MNRFRDAQLTGAPPLLSLPFGSRSQRGERCGRVAF
jgi:hypothetical protein